jgi:peptidyl-tRNA hydrolase, PTH1 family
VEPVLLVGLGNPGDTYAPTRHNVGFRVIDRLGQALGGRVLRSEGDYWMRAVRTAQRPLLLMKPLTYMNNSGTAVAGVLERYAISAEHMLVVVDDVALPLGKLRVRQRGSHGGHNGLYSIMLALQSIEFPRLRCGIGEPDPPGKQGLVDFVLSPFSAAEEPVAERMVDSAAEVALAFARGGLTAALQKSSL